MTFRADGRGGAALVAKKESQLSTDDRKGHRGGSMGFQRSLPSPSAHLVFHNTNPLKLNISNRGRCEYTREFEKTRG